MFRFKELRILLVLLFSITVLPGAFAAEQVPLFDASKTREQLVEDYFKPVTDADKHQDLLLRRCRFYEDGEERNLFVRWDETSGECYDTFNGRFVFRLAAKPGYSSYEAKSISSEYFLPGTVLRNIDIQSHPDTFEYLWHANEWMNALNIPPAVQPIGQEAAEVPKMLEIPESWADILTLEVQPGLILFITQDELDRIESAFTTMIDTNPDFLDVRRISGYKIRQYAELVLSAPVNQKKERIREIREHVKSLLAEADEFLGKESLKVDETAFSNQVARPIPPRLKDDSGNLRRMYESIYPEANRFPRVQDTGTNHPSSLIPRNRDDVPVTQEEIKQLFIIRTFYTEARPLIFFARQKTTNDGKAYHELFTDALLYTKETGADYDEFKPNIPILSSYLPKAPLERLDEGKGEYWHYIHSLIDDSFEETELINRLVNSARTIGDLRKAYERLPQQFWFLQPVDQSVSAEGQVSTFAELQEAIQKTKNGGVIHLAQDITLYHPLFISKKKLTLRSVDGATYSLTRGYELYNPSFILQKGASLTLENVVLDGGTTKARVQLGTFFLYVEDSSLTLGPGSVVRNFYGFNVISAPGGSVTLNGGIIEKNQTMSHTINIFGKGKFVLRSGEIRYNQTEAADVAATIMVYKPATFLMEGGAVHHNAAYQAVIDIRDGTTGKITGGDIYRNTTGNAGAINISGGKLTISGGSIRENYGDRRGVIALEPYIKQNVQLTITGGEVLSNLSRLSCDGIYARTESENKSKIKIEVKGGTVQAAFFGYALFLTGANNQALIAKGVNLIGEITSEDGAKVIDQRK